MKKIIFITVLILATLILVSCNDNKKPDQKEEDLKIIFEEQKLAFNYFWETSNTDKNSPGYGLVLDRYQNNPSLSSVAAVGFGLASIPSGIENNWITKEEGEERAIGTLKTLLSLERYSGFYSHFVNIKTGVRSPGSEISIIDTGLLIAGAITAGEYFGGEVKELAMEIYDGIDWSFYIDESRNMFYMGYDPITKRFSGAWDHVSEQLILYVLAAGSRTFPTDSSMYDLMKTISKNSYTDNYISSSNKELSVEEDFIYTYNGSLFQYQFSHSYIDFRNIVDKDGTNWFNNSVLATKAHYAYVQDESSKYKSYSKNSWGISAGDIPNGYLAVGGKPAKNNVHNGTIAPYAAIASINFLEDEAINAANHFKTIDGLFSEYGFKDSFNEGPHDPLYNPVMEKLTPWVANDYIGIDKGITLLMIENYRSELIWNNFMKNSSVQNGLEKLGFKNV